VLLIVCSGVSDEPAEYLFGYLGTWGDAKLFRQRLNDIHETAAVGSVSSSSSPRSPKKRYSKLSFRDPDRLFADPSVNADDTRVESPSKRAA
jgi:hypothetical protein